LVDLFESYDDARTGGRQPLYKLCNADQNFVVLRFPQFLKPQSVIFRNVWRILSEQ